FYAGVDYRAGFGLGGYSIDDVLGHSTSFAWGWGQWGQAYIGQFQPPPIIPPQPHPNNRYGNGIFIPDPNNPDPAPMYDERSDHPSLFNPYLVRSRSWINLNPGTAAQPRIIPNRTFGVEELRNLNAQYNYAVSSNSVLARLAPATLGNPEFFGPPTT